MIDDVGLIVGEGFRLRHARDMYAFYGLWTELHWAGVLLGAVAVASYVVSARMDPGFIRRRARNRER